LRTEGEVDQVGLGYKVLCLILKKQFKRRVRRAYERQNTRCCLKSVNGMRRQLILMRCCVLEQVMIHKVGDLRSFDKKLDEFQKQGYISAIQRDAMRATLDVGDAAMHRGFVPTEKDLTLALDIIEGVLAPIYDHRTEAEKMADRVPPRARRPD
jgi:hypothetical protein